MEGAAKHFKYLLTPLAFMSTKIICPLGSVNHYDHYIYIHYYVAMVRKQEAAAIITGARGKAVAFQEGRLP